MMEVDENIERNIYMKGHLLLAAHMVISHEFALSFVSQRSHSMRSQVKWSQDSQDEGSDRLCMGLGNMERWMKQSS